MCDICHGIGHCPVCGEEKEIEPCLDCLGEGKFYFDIKDNPITVDQARLFAHFNVYYNEEICSKCDGTGEIEID